NLFLLVAITLIFYILFINLSWALILNKPSEGFLPSSWYVYNILIMIVFVTIFRQIKKTYKVFKVAIIIVIVVELISVLAFPGPGLRAVGTFNNPNQLGYFALLYLSLFYTVIKKS